MAGSAAAEMRRIAKELRSMPRQFADDAAKTLRREGTKQLKADLGGDTVMSHASRRSPAKLRVDAKVEGSQIVTLTVTPGPRRFGGIWSWLESGTRPHVVRGLFDSGDRAAHPGTAPKRTWSRAMDPQTKRLVRDAQRRFSQVVNGF